LVKNAVIVFVQEFALSVAARAVPGGAGFGGATRHISMINPLHGKAGLEQDAQLDDPFQVSSVLILTLEDHHNIRVQLPLTQGRPTHTVKLLRAAPTCADTVLKLYNAADILFPKPVDQ
jgi:hypothetical protein